MAFDPPELIGETKAFAVWGDWINRRKQHFALYDASGMPHRHSGFDGDKYHSAPQDAPDLSLARRTLDGPVLFAGLASKQFGHVLLDSIGRLWALERLPPETTVYFTTKCTGPDAEIADFNAYVTPVLKMLGIRNPVVITRDSLRIDHAYLASDLFSAVHRGRGAAPFYAWIDRCLPPPGPVEPDRAVYVTRSTLGDDSGRFACEDHLERLLQDQGYEIYAPERHGMRDQVELFQRAGKLIFAEGSALHLYGLVARPGQKVAVIQRRPDLPHLIETQLNDRKGHEVTLINAVTQLYWPEHPGDHRARSVIDFDAVGDVLLQAGLIAPGRGWAVPDEAAVQASLRRGLGPGEQLLDRAGRKAYQRARREQRLARQRAG